jgi:hypothetical protein
LKRQAAGAEGVGVTIAFFSNFAMFVAGAEKEYDKPKSCSDA